MCKFKEGQRANFSKEDLKTGMTVQYNDGTYAFVYGNALLTLLGNPGAHGGKPLQRVQDDLTLDECRGTSIVKVWAEHNNGSGSDMGFKLKDESNLLNFFVGELLWERSSEMEVTAMKKSDLKTGMLLVTESETTNGGVHLHTWLVLKDTNDTYSNDCGDVYVNEDGNGWLYGNKMSDDLIYASGRRVIAVYKLASNFRHFGSHNLTYYRKIWVR
jgi:hypothetical protein